MGVKTLHFSSDNPLIPEVTTRWYLKALHHYDIHATPRRATVKALASIYGSKTIYLPFAYSPECHYLDSETEEDPASGDVLFVGYGDSDRYPFSNILSIMAFAQSSMVGVGTNTPSLNNSGKDSQT